MATYRYYVDLKTICYNLLFNNFSMKIQNIKLEEGEVIIMNTNGAYYPSRMWGSAGYGVLTSNQVRFTHFLGGQHRLA